MASELDKYLYYEEIGPPHIRIFLGDCLTIMPLLPKVDLLVTDPPYGIDGEEPYRLTKMVIEIAMCNAEEGYVITDWRHGFDDEDDKYGELVWEYGWISGGRTKSKGNIFLPTHNTIHLLGTPSRKFVDGSIIKRQPGTSSPRQCSFAKKTGHPYEKPKKLIKMLIEPSIRMHILDPFLGSGTTLVACKELKRNGIGIEINEKYCEIAKKRLQNTQVPFL